MGSNTAIKRFTATPADQPLELFDGGHSRMPIIAELLGSPWIRRASDLLKTDGAYATKQVEESVEVVWDPESRCPIAFSRGEHAYRIDTIAQTWSAERIWWDPRRRVSRRFWRVISRNGVFDLVYDRRDGSWFLVGIQD